jgi:hypothetical protein
MEDQNKKPKVAILFFGLTRTLTKLYNNLKANILDELTNNGFDYDIFMHTYILENPYINKWSKENVLNYDNEAYKILNPKYVILENQNEVESKLNLNTYFSNLGNWAGCAQTPFMQQYLVRNMVLALHSKKMVTQLFAEKKDEYDYVIITRPDQHYNLKLNTKLLDLLSPTDNNIIIPREHSYHGLNDRFCICNTSNAIKYGNAFDVLQIYSTKKSIVSEIFMKDYLMYLNLNVIFSPITAHLVRC